MKKIISVIFLCILAFCSVSCSAKNEVNVREIAKPLIVDSIKLNEIIYGKGLSLSDTVEGKYTKVEHEGYKSVSDIKDALHAVFTAEYSELIEKTILSGTSDVHGTLYARYIDINGVLYSHNEAKVYFQFHRKFDFDSIKVKDVTDKRIIFTIDTYSSDIEGNYSDKAERLEIKLIYDEGYEGWRLDTPTY